MKKQVRKHFSYTQCDDFAAYLQEISRRGFHFTEWKGGLVFEKGEPEDVTYQVEVFADGEEMDQRPSQDTEEYRDYCAAAGWKFLDGKARFCIFRKEAEDAPDILAPEERIRNICSLERKLEMRRILFLSLFLLLEVFGRGGALSLVFSNASMFLAAGFAVQILLGAVRSLWIRKGQKRGEAESLCGEKSYLGKRDPFWRGYNIFNRIREFTALVFLAGYFILAIEEDEIFISAVLLVVFFWVSWGMEYLRPSRETIYTLAVLGAGFLWVCLIAFGAFLNENRRPDSGETAVLADGQEIGISQLREDSSFLASDREYEISTEEGETVWIQIYETEQDWLAGKLWEKKEKEEEELYGSAVREEGFGEETEAWRRGEKAASYSIKMDGKLFFAETEEKIPGEKLPLLRELLDLPLWR